MKKPNGIHPHNSNDMMASIKEADAGDNFIVTASWGKYQEELRIAKDINEACDIVKKFYLKAYETVI
jgi:hypothetical protein